MEQYILYLEENKKEFIHILEIKLFRYFKRNSQKFYNFLNIYNLAILHITLIYYIKWDVQIVHVLLNQ